MKDREVRTFPLETRKNDDGTLTITGHPAVFNSRSVDLGGFVEQIAPGAFQETLGKEPDVVFLINHQDLPLARTSSGTLALKESKDGLRMSATVDPEDPDVKRLMPKMKRGDLTKGSFAFRTLEDAWDEVDGVAVRTLLKVDLDGGDVSIVTHPAYRETDVSLAKRGLESWRAERQEHAGDDVPVEVHQQHLALEAKA